LRTAAHSAYYLLLSSYLLPPPPSATPFPYTTLFRSQRRVLWILLSQCIKQSGPVLAWGEVSQQGQAQQPACRGLAKLLPQQLYCLFTPASVIPGHGQHVGVGLVVRLQVVGLLQRTHSCSELTGADVGEAQRMVQACLGRIRPPGLLQQLVCGRRLAIDELPPLGQCCHGWCKSRIAPQRCLQ